jgi:glycosyltransferase involved in cell wall biosynthesis
MRKVYVVTAGDTTRPEEFGGTPHHVISALAAVGAKARGLDLSEGRSDRLRRAGWVLAGFGRLGRPPRGWQWSTEAQALRNRRFQRSNVEPDAAILTMYQCPPDVGGRPLYFYIDGTLDQLFKSYGEVANMSLPVKESAVARELVAYKTARHIFVKTGSAHKSVLETYGIPAQRVSILPPAPNLNLGLIPARVLPPNLGMVQANPIRFVAIGKDFHRKGIDRAVVLMDLLVEAGLIVHLDVVGLGEVDIPARWRRPWLTTHGMIEKSRDPGTFEGILSQGHVGLLLSRAELAGLAMLEYQAAGMVVVASGVGGMKDVGYTSTCIWVESESDDAITAVASSLARSVLAREFYTDMDRAKKEASRVPTWRQIGSRLLGEMA